MIVADDEIWIRERIINSINWAEIGVTIAGEATDGEEALALCRALAPDIILTDIRMPVINGLEFLSALREDSINSKVIIISGYSDFEYAQKALKLGAFDYMLKPIENNDLIQIVKKCVGQIEAEEYKNKILEQANMRLRVHDFIEKKQGNKIRNTVEKAIEFIEQNYNKPITLTDVSEKVMLNASYFSKVFKDSTGEAFVKYLTKYRMRKAVELMKDPTLKIYEIAERVGYDNVQYFIKVFKSIEGISPNIFKENI
jgi:two-component system response regulator YesN